MYYKVKNYYKGTLIQLTYNQKQILCITLKIKNRYKYQSQF